MTPSQRLDALKRLRVPIRSDTWQTIEERRAWLAQIVPLLNFNSIYYTNALPAADILGRPGFSSNMYDQRAAQLESLIGQAITELEHGLTPTESPKEREIALTDEHGLWWFFQHCTTKTRGWMISIAAVILGGAVTAAYFAGRSHFISQAIDLWRKSSTP